MKMQNKKNQVFCKVNYLKNFIENYYNSVIVVHVVINNKKELLLINKIYIQNLSIHKIMNQLIYLMQK